LKSNRFVEQTLSKAPNSAARRGVRNNLRADGYLRWVLRRSCRTVALLVDLRAAT